jgi:dTDP-4-dehydrorhamnose reductase
VRRAVAATRPDAIVHAAILNDFNNLTSRRREAWAAYVEATRNVVDAANAADAHVVLVSTDWVFDGTQGPAAEDEPPNPINAYGFLKAASELVVTERAQAGTVARIAGVQGAHRARPSMPRAQDAGFGYLVASLVEALRAGQPFTVWDGDGLNALATPTRSSSASAASTPTAWRWPAAPSRPSASTPSCCASARRRPSPCRRSRSRATRAWPPRPPPRGST